MKTLFNSVPTLVVSNIKQPTIYPTEARNDIGKTVICHKVIPNRDINKDLLTDNYKLSSLINAGIDPSRMVINTSQSTVESYTTLRNTLNSSVDFLPDSNN